MRLRPLIFAPILAGIACGDPVPPPPAVPPAPPPASTVVVAPPAPTYDKGKPAPPHDPFDNPGGMWMPEQLATQTDTLRKLGVTFDPKLLADPLAPPLSAVVSLGGCTGSFVSKDGLVITNHHCVTGALQHNSTPERNLMKEGFLAKTKDEEKNAGPTARVFVAKGFRDVTAQVLADIDKTKDDAARYKLIEKRTKELTAACEQGKPGIRCSINKYFDGALYVETQQLEIRDVRLVYAPSSGIGNFGGEVDNWRWPRHTGDFSFYRAYVGKDGNPADYSPDNVPYHPKEVLQVATEPLREHDFVMVAGYPGRTNRLRTAQEVKDAVEWYYPLRIKELSSYIAALEVAGKDDKAVALKGAAQMRGFHNALTNFRGTLEGLQRIDITAIRQKEDDAAGAKAGKDGKKVDVAGPIDRAREARRRTRDRDALATSAMNLPRLLAATLTLARLAEEKKKPDAERDPSFQERNWFRLKQAQEALEKGYDPKNDEAILATALHLSAELPAAQRPATLKIITGKTAPSLEEIQAAVKEIYEKTTLADLKTRLAIFDQGTPEELRKSKDPLMKVALALRPIQQQIEDAEKAESGALALARPKYIEALRALHDGVLAPDANSTLRVTYGEVKPWREASAPQGFTTLAQVVAKSTGQDPFDAPPRLLDAAKLDNAPFKDDVLGDVPVDFLSDLDITGGNSGSPTLNRKGELCGLAFDGTYESVASDWSFLPKFTRTIHVDIRYVLWVTDRVDHATNVLTELGVASK